MRGVLACLVICATAGLLPSAADASYAISVDTGAKTATFSGVSTASDDLTLTTTSGGTQLAWYIGANGLPSMDFDSTAVGDQPLANDTGVVITVNAADGNDALIVRPNSANTVKGRVVFSGGNGSDRLELHGSPAADAVTLDGLEVTGMPVGGASYDATTDVLRLQTGGGADVLSVTASARPAFPFQAMAALEEGDDRYVPADGAFVSQFDGNQGTDSIDYSAWTTGVNVPAPKNARYRTTLSTRAEGAPAGRSGLVDLTYDLLNNSFFGRLEASGGIAESDITDFDFRDIATGTQVTSFFPHADWTDVAGGTSRVLGTTTIPALSSDALTNGRIRAVVHTNAFPDGEVSGVITLWDVVGFGVLNATAVGEQDNAGLMSGIERVIGSPQADTLTGTPGPDVLEGGGGVDTIRGGDGNDTIAAADGVADAVLDCGAGDDTLDRDGRDTDPDAIVTACETDNHPPDPDPGAGENPPPSGATQDPPPADSAPVVTPPSVAVTPVQSTVPPLVRATIGKLKPKVSGGTKIGLDGGVTVTCPAQAPSCALVATAKAKLGGRVRTLGKLTRTLGPGKASAIAFKVGRDNSRRWRAAKQRKAKVTISVTLAPAGGQAATVTKTSTLRAPRR